MNQALRILEGLGVLDQVNHTNLVYGRRVNVTFVVERIKLNFQNRLTSAKEKLLREIAYLQYELDQERAKVKELQEENQALRAEFQFA